MIQTLPRVGGLGLEKIKTRRFDCVTNFIPSWWGRTSYTVKKPKDVFGKRTWLQKNYNSCLGGIPFGYLVGQKD